jgi:glutathione S-transferase
MTGYAEPDSMEKLAAAPLTLRATLEALIEAADGPFKVALDGYKYAAQGDIATDYRTAAAGFIDELETRLAGTANLTRTAPGLADAAIAAFVRQFAHVDLVWFSAQDWPQVNRWLSEFKASHRFAAIMGKYPRWQAGDAATRFPEAA